MRSLTLHHPTSPRRSWRRIASAKAARWIVAAVCGLGVAPSAPCAAMPEDAPLDDARSVMEKWIETQRIISQEKRDLELAKEMLTERIELVRREIQENRAKIAETRKSAEEAAKKREEMLAENEEIKNATGVLADTLARLEDRTRDLLRKLPDPIRERIKPLSQRLPTNSQETRLPLSERFQNVVGILNEVNKFNREITVTSEVRALPNGGSAEVTALYLGLGQGYYVGSNGQIAGTGTATDAGWVWTPNNEAAPEIARIIAILANEQVAAFVQIPVQIR